MNPAYKKLNNALRIGPLTMSQWVVVGVGAFIAIVWVTRLSPFGQTMTLVTAVYGPGLLIGAAIGAGMVGIDLTWTTRCVLTYLRLDGRCLAGASDTPTPGYVVEPDPDEAAALSDALEVGDLWAT